jgi:hypothetical protein
MDGSRESLNINRPKQRRVCRNGFLMHGINLFNYRISLPATEEKKKEKCWVNSDMPYYFSFSDRFPKSKTLIMVRRQVRMAANREIQLPPVVMSSTRETTCGEHLCHS